MNQTLPGVPDNEWVFYTDGSCIGNPGPAGIGVVACFSNTDSQHLSKGIGRATNNIAELEAINLALQMICERLIEPRTGPSPPLPLAIRIRSDSKYAIGVVTKGWKISVNVELITSVKRRFALAKTLCPDIELRYVPAHSNIVGNELADKLALRGARSNITTIPLIGCPPL